MPLNRRKDILLEEVKQDTKSLAEQVREQVKEEPIIVETKKIQWENVKIVSTGSTLLDLDISGGRIYEGGIPCCILCEVHGPSGSGKTALLSEVGASVQSQDGDIMYLDPEARMDLEYSRIYEMELDKTNYWRPDTVGKVFEHIKKWKSEKPGPMATLTDSLAALTTDLEMSDKGDKMGMRRAKEFSQGLRLNARIIANMLLLCSNQERDGDYGKVTPGGNAIGYYSSLRIRLKQVEKIESEKKLIRTILEKGKPKEVEIKISKAVGIKSEYLITKSTIDDPYRTNFIYIIFGYGIDDIRGNLQYLKEMKAANSYPCPDSKSYMGMEQAIKHIEENNLVADLKKETVIIWHEIEDLFKANRERKKVR